MIWSCNYSSLKRRSAQRLRQKNSSIYWTTITQWNQWQLENTFVSLTGALELAWSNVPSNFAKSLWWIASLEISEACWKVSVVGMLRSNWTWPWVGCQRTHDYCNFWLIVWLIHYELSRCKSSQVVDRWFRSICYSRLRFCPVDHKRQKIWSSCFCCASQR